MEDAIIITLATIGSALIGLIIRYSFRSKCEDVNCCFGCLKFHRDVKSEKAEITTQESNEEITKRNI
jgi:hypothetical protein